MSNVCSGHYLLRCLHNIRTLYGCLGVSLMSTSWAWVPLGEQHPLTAWVHAWPRHLPKTALLQSVTPQVQESGEERLAVVACLRVCLIWRGVLSREAAAKGRQQRGPPRTGPCAAVWGCGSDLTVLLPSLLWVWVFQVPRLSAALWATPNLFQSSASCTFPVQTDFVVCTSDLKCKVHQLLESRCRVCCFRNL